MSATPAKPRRFTYHFNKPASARLGRPVMSVHWQGRCHIVDGIVCSAVCESHVNRRQPRVVMRGWARGVRLTRGVALIS